MQISYRTCGHAAAVSAALAVLAGHPALAQHSPALQDVIAKAKQEHELVVSWSENTLGGLQGSKDLAAGMKKMFGVDFHIKFSPGPSMARSAFKVITEAKADQKSFTDVLIGPSFTVAELVKRNLFIPYDWAKLLPGRIPDGAAEEHNQVLRIATGLPGVTVNTTTLPGGKMPTKLTDFLKPEWKGKFAGTPYAASFEAISSPSVMGPEKSIDLVKRLSDQMSGVIRCSEGERIATGEFPALVMDCGRQTALVWKQKGAPLEHVLLEDYAQKRFFYLGVPKNAAHPNLAALFIVYGMTEQGQSIYRSEWGMDLDSFPGSQQGKTVAALEKRGAKFIDVTVPFWLGCPECATSKKQMVKIIRGRGKALKQGK